jgi:hypothetical protein
VLGAWEVGELQIIGSAHALFDTARSLGHKAWPLGRAGTAHDGRPGYLLVRKSREVLSTANAFAIVGCG